MTGIAHGIPLVPSRSDTAIEDGWLKSWCEGSGYDNIEVQTLAMD